MPGVDDQMRTDKLVQGAIGKRLTYHTTHREMNWGGPLQNSKRNVDEHP